MIAVTESFIIPTHGKGTYEITDDVSALLKASGIRIGLATVFLQHTSASLVIYENADSTARADLHSFFEDLVPEDNPSLIHTAEGPDDSTSHLRMALTRTCESVPVAGTPPAWHLAGNLSLRAPKRSSPQDRGGQPDR